jgi:hypothetical protein
MAKSKIETGASSSWDRQNHRDVCLNMVQAERVSKAYGRHILAVGINKPGKGKHGFHSLRETAVQTIKSAKVPLEWRCAYVGHDRDEEHVEMYSGEYSAPLMIELVSPGLIWSFDLRPIKTLLFSANFDQVVS